MDSDFLDYIKKLKQDNNLKIVDVHVHPFDVMGLVHYHNYKEGGEGKLFYKNKKKEKVNYLKPGFSESLKFNNLSFFLSRQVFKLSPKFIANEIEDMYGEMGNKRAIDEMDASLVDEIVFLPVEPWANTDWSGKYFTDKRFLLLGSLDIYKIKKEEIENTIEKYIEKYNIIGIKLHPNLQNFKPRPKDNSPEIKEKLEEIYRVAEKRRLFLLFHGGTSFFTKKVSGDYKDFKRSKTNGLLENFCDTDGTSEIFDLNIPIVIAHLGHFGIKKANYNLVKNITNKYSNVYFDTAGASPSRIKEFIELIGDERILLGSDAFYNKMAYAMYFVYQAAKQTKTDKSLDQIMINILGGNFYNKILNRND
jgi:predicted TIM-barrel fold metal-dependent hydrolase